MRAFSLVALVALSACTRSNPGAPPDNRAPALAAPEPRSSGSTSASLLNNPLSRASLATLDPGGQTQIDLSIRKLEERVNRLAKVDNWVLLGQAWVRKARESADPVYYLSADACAAEAIKLDPKSEQAAELRVLLQLSNHQFARARETAEAALRERPDSPLMLGLLSDAQMDQGDYDGAHKSLQAMMDLKPNLPSYSRVAYLQWLSGDEAGALGSVRLAIDAGDPKEPEALAWVLVQAAMMFWQRGDYPGADAGFDRALATFYDFPPALVGKGRVALAQGDSKRAAELLDKAFRQSPLLSTAWLLVDARVASGDTSGAAAIDAVLRKNESTDPRTYAQYLAAHDRDHAQALQLASDERKTRDDLYTEDAYAWALYRAGKLEAARAASDKAQVLATPDASLWYHAGAIRIAQGQVPAGVALVKKALARNPYFDVTGHTEALALIAAHAR